MSEGKPTIVGKHAKLFKNFSFKFIGLKPETEKGYIQVVKNIGGKVSDDAAFILVEPTYYNSIKNKGNSKFYNIRYILDSIEAEKPLDINLYRCDYNEILCSKCANENKENNITETNRCTEVAIKNIRTDATELPLKLKVKNINSLLDNDEIMCLSSSEEPMDCEEIVDFNKQTITKIKVEPSNKVTSQNDMVVVISDDDETDDEMESKKLKENTKFINVKKEKSDVNNKNHACIPGHSKWNDFEDTFNNKKITSKKQKKKYNYDSPESELSFDSDEEEQRYNNKKMWWLNPEIDPHEICTFPACSYEPRTHKRHAMPSRMLSLDEKQIILKYLINTNSISSAKGLQVWNDMHYNGYLTHRSVESLRNCLRRTILPVIETFGLPEDLVRKFKDLEEPYVVLNV